MQGDNESIWKLSMADIPVNIYDKQTWGDEDFSHLLIIVQSTILPHMSQNQLIENHIQMAAQVRKTGVEEERASARVMQHSFHIRPYNKLSVELKREELKDDKAKCSNKFKRTKDAARVEGYADHMDQFNKDIRKLELEIDHEGKYKQVLADIRGNDDKASNEENNKKAATFEKAAKARRQIISAEEKKGGIYKRRSLAMKLLSMKKSINKKLQSTNHWTR